MIENIDKLLNRMSRPLSLLESELIYTSHNVIFERSDLYLDFILTLDDLIESTYLGHDMMTDKDRLDHYTWCWVKTCDLVNTKLINFNQNDNAFTYLLDTYLESFYDTKKDIITHLKKFWELIFNYNIKKSKPEIESYVKLYKTFELSFKKKRAIK